MYVIIWITSVLSIVIGFSAISIAIFGTLRAPSKRPYIYMIIFYGAYTVQTFVSLVGDVVLSYYTVNVALLILIVSALETSLGVLVICAAALYFHELFSSSLRRLRDILVIIIAIVTILLYLLPSSISVDPEKRIIVLGLFAYAAGIIYLLLFVYLLLVGFLGSKRDRPARELVLIWAILAFGSTGLIESIISIIGYLQDPVVQITYTDENFLISTIPHIFMGVVMIYYFGGYILADRPSSDNTLSDAFLKKFNISQRESEVIALMDRGLSNREIAEKLFVSLATVKTHAHNIYEKTGAKSRYSLSHMIRGEKGVR